VNSWRGGSIGFHPAVKKSIGSQAQSATDGGGLQSISSDPDPTCEQRSVHKQGRAKKPDYSNNKPSRSQPYLSQHHEQGEGNEVESIHRDEACWTAA